MFCGVFLFFWVIFGDVWEEIVFLKGLIEFRQIKKNWRLNVILKLEFNVGRRTPDRPPDDLESSCVGTNYGVPPPPSPSKNDPAYLSFDQKRVDLF